MTLTFFKGESELSLVKELICNGKDESLLLKLNLFICQLPTLSLSLSAASIFIYIHTELISLCSLDNGCRERKEKRKKKGKREREKKRDREKERIKISPIKHTSPNN